MCENKNLNSSSKILVYCCKVVKTKDGRIMLLSKCEVGDSKK